MSHLGMILAEFPKLKGTLCAWIAYKQGLGKPTDSYY